VRYPCGWVSPFGHRRIKACCQLPDAFRRLPRPSSPLTAKASTVCAYSLDHITPSRLGRYVVRERYDFSLQIKVLSHLALASTTRHGHSSQNARYIRFVKEHASGFSAGRVSDLRVRNCHSELVGLGGLEPPASPLSGVRSNHLSYRPKKSRQVEVVEPVGIEPTTPCLQSRCSPS
jgi:hypothetical protein